MSWLFGQADQGGGAGASRSPMPPAPVELTQPINRWEQDYLRAAGGGDFLRDDVETGFSGGGGASATTSAAPYYRQTSSPDRVPGSSARSGGPSLAELARSVSDANVYYSQRPPSRPLPTAPETSPWVDADAGRAMLLRQNYGADLQGDRSSQLSPQTGIEPLSNAMQVQKTAPLEEHSSRTLHRTNMLIVYIQRYWAWS